MSTRGRRWRHGSSRGGRDAPQHGAPPRRGRGRLVRRLLDEGSARGRRRHVRRARRRDPGDALPAPPSCGRPGLWEESVQPLVTSRSPSSASAHAEHVGERRHARASATAKTRAPGRPTRIAPTSSCSAARPRSATASPTTTPSRPASSPCSPPPSDVNVFNFARGYYYSTQEHILFEQLLRAGHVPAVAIFIEV